MSSETELKILARSKRLDAEVAKWIIQIDRIYFKSLNKLFASAKDILNQVINLPKELEKQGLSGQIAKITNSYKNKITDVKDDYESLGLFTGFTPNAKKLIEARIVTAIDEINTEVKAFTLRTQQVALSAGFSGEVFNFEKYQAERVGSFLNVVERSIINNVESFGKELTIKAGIDVGLKYYTYSGTLIKTSRPFCIARAGKAFSLDEINAMDNGQGLPVFTYMGGYNCRHHWQPISDNRAREVYGKV